MTASRPVIIETCPSALCSTRSPPVSPIWVVLSCGCVAKQHGRGEKRRTWGVFLTVNRRSIDDIDARFSKVIQVLFGGLMPGWSARAISWAGDVLPPLFHKWPCCGTLTLSWSRGEKRCRTSLGPCWWRAARPIRRRAVSHHVTASPIAIYFTIGQMKRLILTICSLMCFSPSLTLAPPHPRLLFSGCKLLALAETKFKKIICYVGSRFRTQLMGGIVWTGNLNHQLHLLFTIVN